MSGFADRMRLAAQFEADVIAALHARGWHAEPFGQALLSTAIREALRQAADETPLRWLPDIIASKRFASRTLTVLIDAKSGHRWKETGNQCVETAAARSQASFAEWAGIPIYIVFESHAVMTPAVILEIGYPGPHHGHGSGTEFLLIPDVAGVSFDAVFGSRD